MKIENVDLILDTVDNGILLVNEDLNILYWNAWLEIRTGIKKAEIISKNLLDIYPAIKARVLKRKIKTVLSLDSSAFYNAENSNPLIKIKQTKFTEKEFEYMQQSITIVPYDRENKIVCIHVYDNTRLSEQNFRLKQLTDKLKDEMIKNQEKDKLMYEQSKMAALGDMIHNIAHQWRQPLSVISTSATGVSLQNKMGMLGDEFLAECMQNINENAQYLSNTIDTFRNFVKHKKRYEVIDIIREVHKSINLISPTLKHYNVKLLFENNCLEQNIPVRLISYELPEVIINILNNAKDNFVEKNIDNPWIKLDIIKKEKTVLITIEDNGGGIRNDILTKIFEPYFTTKHKGMGTGLGLHIAYNIVKDSLKGNIYVKNTENGAKFFIELSLEN